MKSDYAVRVITICLLISLEGCLPKRIISLNRAKRQVHSDDLCSTYPLIDSTIQFVDATVIFIQKLVYWQLIEGEAHPIPYKPLGVLTDMKYLADHAHKGSITQLTEGVEETFLFSLKHPNDTVYVLKDKIYHHTKLFSEVLPPHDENPDPNVPIGGAFSFQSKKTYIHVVVQTDAVWVWYRKPNDELKPAPNYPQSFTKVFGASILGFTGLYFSQKEKAAYFLVRSVYFSWKVDNRTDVLEGGLKGTLSPSRRIDQDLLKCAGAGLDTTQEQELTTSVPTTVDIEAPEASTASDNKLVIMVAAAVIGIVVLVSFALVVVGIVYKKRKDREGVYIQVALSFVSIINLLLFWCLADELDLGFSTIDDVEISTIKTVDSETKVARSDMLEISKNLAEKNLAEKNLAGKNLAEKNLSGISQETVNWTVLFDES